MSRGGSAGVLAIDPHVHTADSYDSTATVEAVVRRAERVGLNGLVVTDHDRIERSRRAAALASEAGLIGIPGVEVSTADGHLLAIGVTSQPDPERPLAETVASVRDRGGVAVVPHPFQRTRHGASAAALSDCDGIEVFNAHCLTGLRNGQAERFAASHGYPRFGGSDAHRPAAIGHGVTYVRTDVVRPTADDIVAAMRAGRTRADGRRTSSLRYLGKLARNARIRGSGVTLR